MEFKHGLLMSKIIEKLWSNNIDDTGVEKKQTKRHGTDVMISSNYVHKSPEISSNSEKGQPRNFNQENYRKSLIIVLSLKLTWVEL